MSSWRALVIRHRVLAYFALAYTLSWSYWLPLALRGDIVRAGQGWPTHLPGLLGPAVAAAAVTAVTDGREGLRDLGRRFVRWRKPGRWWLVVAATLALAPLAVLVPLVTGAARPTWEDFFRYTGIGMITPLGVVLIAMVVNGFGEETGWRGFAVEHLVRDHSLTWTTLAVSIGWAGWHLPLFFIVDSFRQMGPLAIGWLVGMVAGSVVLAYLYVQGGRSIPLVAAWHTAFNLTSATEATGAVVGTATSMVVILWAVWILRRDQKHTADSQPSTTVAASPDGVL